MYADDVVLVAGSGAELHVGCGRGICVKWKMKFNNRRARSW